MSKSQPEITQEALETVQAITKEMVNVAKHILYRKCCDKPEHYTVPKNYADWDAIDRCMANVSSALSRTLSIYAMFNSQRLMGNTTGDLIIDICHLEMICKSCADVLQFHHELVERYGRGNNADLHYDQIINMVEVKNASMLKSISTVENLQSAIDTMRTAAKEFRSGVNEAFDSIVKTGKTATGETIQ